MQRIYMSIFLAMCLLSAFMQPRELRANDVEKLLERAPNAFAKLSNGALGREFWLAIPPNEVDGYGNTQALEIYVSSPYNTEVTLEVPGFGMKMTKPVKAGEVTVFSDDPGIGGMSWEYEVRKSEQVTHKGIHVYADEPVSVYVFSARRYTSEGYMALPATSFGTEYMHVGHYDFKDGGGERGGGFIVVAQEDSTILDLTLAGSGTFGATATGKPLGYRYKVQLARGQTWMVRGNGEDPTFDITGTKVYANKPVGVISFQMRTIIPVEAAFNSRDMITEMLPPTTAWGTDYATIELNRKDRGDFFRIVAAQDSTSFTLRYYDRNTRELLGTKTGFLARAGQWQEYENAPLNPTVTSIRGSSVWQADKPVLVAQYSYSAGWDNVDFFDPFMVYLTPRAQYLKATMFQTPARATFATNWLNIIAEGDTNDPAQEKLRSLQLDGQALYKSDAGFLTNRIPGTNLYWGRVSVKPGAHIVRGAARFGGYLYGINSFESYGWSIGGAWNRADVFDTLAPDISGKEGARCGHVDLLIKEDRSANPNDDPRQVDAGISVIEIIEELSYNYSTPSVVFNGDTPAKTATLKLRTADKREDAKVVFVVRDAAGNVRVDSIVYHSPKLEFVDSTASYFRTRVGSSDTNATELRNNGAEPVEVLFFSNLSKNVFELLDAPAVPFTLEPGQSIPLRVVYRPIKETGSLHNPNAVDAGSLGFATRCVELKLITLTGRGVQPHISVGSWFPEILRPGARQCNTVGGKKGLPICNTGSDTLTVTALNGLAAPFILDTDNNLDLPLRIPPNSCFYVRGICFAPAAEGEYSVTLTVESDAPAGDPNTGILRGTSRLGTSVGADIAGTNVLQGIYPNPARDEATLVLHLDRAAAPEVFVYDALGRAVGMHGGAMLNAGQHKLALLLGGLAPGIYYISVRLGPLRETIPINILP